MKAKKNITQLNLQLILFEKAQPFAKQSIYAWFSSVKPSYSKSLSIIAITSAIISLESFPPFSWYKRFNLTLN